MSDCVVSGSGTSAVSDLFLAPAAKRVVILDELLHSTKIASGHMPDDTPLLGYDEVFRLNNTAGTPVRSSATHSRHVRGVQFGPVDEEYYDLASFASQGGFLLRSVRG